MSGRNDSCRIYGFFVSGYRYPGNLNEILILLRFFIDKQQRNGYNYYKIYTKHKLESNFCLLDMLFFR
ncbi:hypothetical protein B5E77_10070 [Lachnoclostridium sp. An131]|nr:hypothetical protein B5E77_10070 [Lachnoclostridium sp. An131]